MAFREHEDERREQSQTPYDVRGLYIAFLGNYGIIPCYTRMYYELKYISLPHPTPAHTSMKTTRRSDMFAAPIPEIREFPSQYPARPSTSCQSVGSY